MLRIVSLVYCAALAAGAAIDSPPTKYDTIVVGMGSSGTTAARTLALAGRRVLALEAQGRIGGRVNTVPFGQGVVELGAEWIHGTEKSPVYDIAVANNISVVEQSRDMVIYRSDGSTVDLDMVFDLSGMYFESVDNPPKVPEPLGQYVSKKIRDRAKEKYPELEPEFMENFLELMNLLVNEYEGSGNWNDVSTMSSGQDLGGNPHMSWHSYGYKTFFELLLNTYNNGTGIPNLEIKLNTEVTQIKWSQGPKAGVEVTCKDGSVYTADNVIVTVSVGVLKERHQTLFNPPLPAVKTTAIDKIPLGIVDKIILCFDEIWWPKADAFAVIWKNEDKKVLEDENNWYKNVDGPSQSMGSPNCLEFWVTGETAKKIETLSDEEVKSNVLDKIRRYMFVNLTVPEPSRMFRSAWYSNPYVRGSYTYDGLDIVDHPTVRSDLAAPLLDSAGNPRVLFAGEATHSKHYSTVHGASETGYREAMRLLPASDS